MNTIKLLALRNTFAAITLSFILVHGAGAQVSKYVYGINNASPGVFYFCKVDLTSGELTNLTLTPMNYSAHENACVDNINKIYYLVFGASVTGYDVVTGNAVYNATLPIPTSASFIQSVFDDHDTLIYGIINNPPNSTFASFKPSTGVFSIIAALPSNMWFCQGCMTVIDPVNRLFIFQDGSLIGLRLSTGEEVFNQPIIDVTDETFGHIAYDLNTHRIYGTSANISANTKYLSTVDPVNGSVSHVSETGWNSGIWKPSTGGDCINQGTGIFYYSASGNLLNGISISTGEIVSSQTVNAGMYLLLIQSLSDGTSGQTGIAQTSHAVPAIKISPNPFVDETTFSADLSLFGNNCVLSVTDETGKEIKQISCADPTMKIDLKNYPPGLYFYFLKNENKILTAGKLIMN